MRKYFQKNPMTPGLLDHLTRPPQSVVLVCASRIGDFICATPAFRALKARLPDSSITLIGLPFIKEMVARNPHLQDFERFPGFPGIAEQFFNARKAGNFLSRMQRKHFDLAIQMHGSGVYSNSFTLMLGARFTAGFVREGSDTALLDAALSWPCLHASRRALALAEFLGAPCCGTETEFALLPEDHAAADRLLHGCSKPFIGLHPWSREPEKVWPLERFAAAASLIQHGIGGTVIVVGGPLERAGGEQLRKTLGSRACNLAGRKSLPEMCAIISRLSVLITNDSGPAHIAYARGTPTVTLFGKTDPEEWGPPDRPCHRILRAQDCKLSSIQVDEVVRTAIKAAGPQR